ncbi:MAG: M67 family metallopeptidase [Alphaproteobacteria bacterium]|nr:M67 family metallopeptidase [Alphaproteobacteria bacterium]
MWSAPGEVSRLVLPRIVAEAIEGEARAALPRECCGLLVGTAAGGEASAVRAVPSRNLADDPATRFEIDPALRLAAQREAREAGLLVLGHYHSHPAGPARPSARDLAGALEGGLVWLILGLEGGRASFAAFQARRDRREPSLAPLSLLAAERP